MSPSTIEGAKATTTLSPRHVEVILTCIATVVTSAVGPLRHTKLGRAVASMAHSMSAVAFFPVSLLYSAFLIVLFNWILYHAGVRPAARVQRRTGIPGPVTIVKWYYGYRHEWIDRIWGIDTARHVGRFAREWLTPARWARRRPEVREESEDDVVVSCSPAVSADMDAFLLRRELEAWQQFDLFSDEPWSLGAKRSGKGKESVTTPDLVHWDGSELSEEPRPISPCAGFHSADQQFADPSTYGLTMYSKPIPSQRRHNIRRVSAYGDIRKEIQISSWLSTLSNSTVSS